MSPASDSPARAGLGRSALLGLCGGLLIGGGVLLFLGLRGLFGTPDCAHLSPLECSLVQETSREVGRVQTLCGGALLALALSLYVLLRPYLPQPPDSPQKP